MKNAAVQVEIDELMVIRRLNLEIQGFPESYVADLPPQDNVLADSYTYEQEPYKSPPFGPSSMSSREQIGPRPGGDMDSAPKSGAPP